MSEVKTRKSVCELSTSDLETHPVWEFALDEEDEEGQDETTVRPHPVDGELDPSEGMFVVRATFRLADGSEARGYLTPPTVGDDGLGTVQPVIVTDGGQVLFWCGSIGPSPEVISRSYERLGKTSPADVFPIRFSADVPIVGGPVQGELPGFIHLEDWKTGTTRVMR